MPLIVCTFKLNGKALSTFSIDGKAYPAFSGMGQDKNVKQSACLKSVGPIPPGTYYIVDRPKGGTLGTVRDWLGNKGDWFALYADDGSVDDSTLCDHTVRGNFRLHPKGPLGRSEGCITIEKLDDFNAIRKTLKSYPLKAIPKSELKTYAMVRVE